MIILGGIEMRKRTSLDGLAVYLGSLRRHHPDVPVVLFNRSPAHPGLRALINRYDVESVDAAVFERAYGIPPVEIEIARFLSYGHWLDAYPSDPVVMTDVLDVAWQAPFRPPPDLTVYQENVLVGACPYNSKWLQESFPGWEDVATQPVVCCGVITGPLDQVRSYLTWYREQCLLRPRRRGFDSAAVNRYPGPVSRVPHLNPACIHLGYADRDAVSLSSSQITVGGVAPAVLHQYNRHPVVTQELYTRWT